MVIKLQKLTLENFKGVRKFTLKADGENVTVRGDNGTGKTTLKDAFLWLLFGIDGNGKADFQLKTVNESGEELHNLDHMVEGVLDIDGKLVTLKKVYAEKYQKKRGFARAEFTGHTTQHYIDEILVQKKEWGSRISEIIDEDTFKLLTSPTYFNSLHWQKRRETLLKICGDVSDIDVIDSNPELRGLPEILGDRKLEDHRKVIAAKRKEINDRLKEIPARIDELNKSLGDVSGYNKKEIQARITALEWQIMDIDSNGVLPKLRQGKAELVAKLSEAKNAIREAEHEAEKDIRRKLSDVAIRLNSAHIDLENTVQTIWSIQTDIEAIDKKIESLRDEFKYVSAQKFQGDTVCPTCGQDIPQNEVDEAIQKHNNAKAEKLAEINERGRAMQNENAKRRERLEELTVRESNLKTEIENLKKLDKQLIQAQAKAVENAGLKEKGDIKEIKYAIYRVEEKIKDVSMKGDDSTDLKSELKTWQSKIAEIDATKKTEARIDVLAKEEKSLATEYEEFERQTVMMEQFIISKVGLLNDKINSRFWLARFKLFDEQINGGANETCVTLCNGVPYGSGLNTGAEINVGLDIIHTLSDHYGVRAPVFIDHTESVTSPLNPGSQTIKLIVDKNHNELVVEHDIDATPIKEAVNG